jgi:hypothetical protein
MIYLPIFCEQCGIVNCELSITGTAGQYELTAITLLLLERHRLQEHPKAKESCK